MRGYNTQKNLCFFIFKAIIKEICLFRAYFFHALVKEGQLFAVLLLFTQSKPISLNDNQLLSETIKWSSNSIPKTSPASIIRRVKPRSASDGVISYQ